MATSERCKSYSGCILFDKAMYEVNYELSNSPDRVLPLPGILQMPEAEAEPGKTASQAAQKPEETAKEAGEEAKQKAEK